MRPLPPTRYKVVERGRRLEVIDTWNGNAPVHAGMPEPDQSMRRGSDAPVRAVRASKLTERGQTILTTSNWYDAKGPRRIVLTEAGEAKLLILKVVAGAAAVFAAVVLWFFWPLLFVAAFALMRSETRATLRKGGAGFLDTINDPD